MSTGLSFGLKLPTGDFTGPKGPLGGAEFDRDSLPGTGSTDLMIGAYHAGQFGVTSRLSYFLQTRYQFAVAERDSYRPGNESDTAVGLIYDLGARGPASRIAPMLQLLNSYRDHDSGTNADYLNSGYERLLLGPGVEAQFNHVRLYADIAVPIYQHTNAASSLAIEGESGQLIAPALFTLQTSYDF
jgi:outer membrane receptor for ferric coprogen and ferric-rhodotorulic acid